LIAPAHVDVTEMAWRGEAVEKESFAAAAKLFSQLRANAGNRRRRLSPKGA
jgi:hypothetical protein